MWYLSTPSKKLGKGSNLIATIIRLLWRVYTLKLRFRGRITIPSWEKRLPLAAILANLLEEHLTSLRSDTSCPIVERLVLIDRLLRMPRRGANVDRLCGEPTGHLPDDPDLPEGQRQLSFEEVDALFSADCENSLNYSTDMGRDFSYDEDDESYDSS